MDQKDIGWITRWVVALCEPLVTTAERREIEDQVVSVVAREPRWFSAWAAGFISDLVRSLDPEDPWRNLEVDGHRALLPDGSPFGTWVDATDIVPPSLPDRRSDLGLAALEIPLSERAAELVAVAAGGWRPTMTWLEDTFSGATRLDEKQASEFFETAYAAIRWAMFRRRLFAGKEDPFIPVAAAAWLSRAEKMANAESWDEARAARVLDSNKIQPGTYEQFV